MKNFDSFDDVYRTQDWYYGLKPFRELPETLQKLSMPHNSQAQALDLGCGEGRDSMYLAANGFNVTAIDISEQGLLKLKNIAQEKKLSINCIQINALEYEFPINTYSVVVARTFLDHLTTSQIIQIIPKIQRTLCEAGVIFISVFTTKDAGYIKGLAEGESECASFIQHYFEQDELKNYFMGWELLTYYERTKMDTSHGPPHQHGVAHLVAQKPSSL